MEVKIKNNEELVDATIEMIDGVMVVSPKEVKFEPKNGDVIVCGGNIRFIAIFERMKEEYSFYYHALLVLEENRIPQLGSWASLKDARPATEEEKNLLFDKLAEIGYKFDVKGRKLVKLRWKPKVGETFYRIGLTEHVFHTTEHKWEEVIYENVFKHEWIFPTKEECQAVCDKFNQVIP